ncbi:unnamed protein product [Notodromas monacha]|uniref:Uncharacterized protein n=1 Tax=Notodromas monacha TaxID=399045 RepID=A0A7R9GD27_9CRUS|nr:unnamed protein product [Notodromas monacha]CAG0918263.1 unnamed protein product [Notodromas monacha]
MTSIPYVTLGFLDHVESQCLVPQKHDVAQINSALSKLTDISPKTDKAAGGEPPMGSSPWPGFPWSNYPLFGQNVVTPSEDSMIPEPGSTRTTLASNSGSSCVSQQTSVCGGLGFEAIEGMDPRYQAIFSELQEHSHSTPLKKNNTLPSPNDSPSATAKIKKLESVSRSKLTSTKPMWEDSSAASLRASNTSETLSVDENSQYLPAARMRAGKIFDD